MVHWKILAVKFAFVIIFEHVVFGVCKLIDILVPDIPASLDIKIKRERYLAKEALQDAEGHDTDTETNSNNAFFRKQSSYENPCHTTPVMSSSFDNPGVGQSLENNSTKFNRTSDSSPLL